MKIRKLLPIMQAVELGKTRNGFSVTLRNIEKQDFRAWTSEDHADAYELIFSRQYKVCLLSRENRDMPELFILQDLYTGALRHHSNHCPQGYFDIKPDAEVEVSEKLAA
jgi:hypothetical protein